MYEQLGGWIFSTSRRETPAKQKRNYKTSFSCAFGLKEKKTIKTAGNNGRQSKGKKHGNSKKSKVNG